MGHHFPLLRFRSVAIVRPFPGPFLEIFDVRNVALLSTPFFQTRWSIFSPPCRPPFGARAWSIHSTYDTAAEREEEEQEQQQEKGVSDQRTLP